MHEIIPEAGCEVTQALTYVPAPVVKVMGAELRRFRLEADECPGSVILECKRASAYHGYRPG